MIWMILERTQERRVLPIEPVHPPPPPHPPSVKSQAQEKDQQNQQQEVEHKHWGGQKAEHKRDKRGMNE